MGFLDVMGIALLGAVALVILRAKGAEQPEATTPAPPAERAAQPAEQQPARAGAPVAAGPAAPVVQPRQGESARVEEQARAGRQRPPARTRAAWRHQWAYGLVGAAITVAIAVWLYPKLLILTGTDRQVAKPIALAGAPSRPSLALTKPGPELSVEDPMKASAQQPPPPTAPAVPPVDASVLPVPIKVTGSWPGPWRVTIHSMDDRKWLPSGIWVREGAVYAHSAPTSSPGLELGLRIGKTIYGPWNIGPYLDDPRTARFFPTGSGELVYRIRARREARFTVVESALPADVLVGEVEMKQWKQGSPSIDQRL